mmetsp:Transcript_6538/g.16633  ORF Transcript_6538/g.16633 Transcript_6538/m.16633 type:complete len:294 (+) Transcript_6538:352-1233(+)
MVWHGRLERHFGLQRLELFVLLGLCRQRGHLGQHVCDVLFRPGGRGGRRDDGRLHQLPVELLGLELLQLEIELVLVDLRREPHGLAQRLVDLPHRLGLLGDFLHRLVDVLDVRLLLHLLHRLGARAHRAHGLRRRLCALEHDLLVVDAELLVRQLVCLGLVKLLTLQALQSSALVFHFGVLLGFGNLVGHLLLQKGFALLKHFQGLVEFFDRHECVCLSVRLYIRRAVLRLPEESLEHRTPSSLVAIRKEEVSKVSNTRCFSASVCLSNAFLVECERQSAPARATNAASGPAC